MNAEEVERLAMALSDPQVAALGTAGPVDKQITGARNTCDSLVRLGLAGRTSVGRQYFITADGERVLLAVAERLDDPCADLRAELESAEAEAAELRQLLQQVKDVVGWFEPGNDARAIRLRDDVWELVK